MGPKLFIGTPLVRNEVVLKRNLVWAILKCIVSLDTHYMILDKGVGLQIESYLGIYLS